MTNAEDTCQRVTYTYDANISGSTYSQYYQGRLTAVQYSACATGHTRAVTEPYRYHPAGGVTGKRLQTQICGTDGEGNFGCPTASSDVAYTFDSKGAVLSVLYPGAANPYVYGSDWAGRHVSLSQVWQPLYYENPVTAMLVQNAQFDVAGRLSSIQLRSGVVGYSVYDYRELYGGWGYYSNVVDAFETETRSYNTMGQLTSLGWAPNPVTDSNGGPYTNPYAFTKSLTYAYPAAGSNNGQLASMSDGTGGETVTYQYDALKRLISAAATPNSGGPAAGTQTYGFDGFGNLTSKVLNGTTAAIPVDGATNRLTSATYDANGNMLTGAGATLAY